MLFIKILDAVVFLYVIMIAINALEKWLRPEVVYTYGKFFSFVARFVNPLLVLVRRIFPTDLGRVDLSPVIAVILVETVKFVVIYLIGMLMSGKPS